MTCYLNSIFTCYLNNAAGRKDRRLGLDVNVKPQNLSGKGTIVFVYIFQAVQLTLLLMVPVTIFFDESLTLYHVCLQNFKVTMRFSEATVVNIFHMIMITMDDKLYLLASLSQ